jgi:Holliday junction resolvase RusA-like endonuclease
MKFKSEFKSFVFQNNFRIFADVLINRNGDSLLSKTGNESVEYIYKKLKKHSPLIDYTLVHYLYYQVFSSEYHNPLTSPDFGVLIDLSEKLVPLTEYMFHKHLSLEQLFTIWTPSQYQKGAWDNPQQFDNIVMLPVTPIGKPTWQKSDRWSSRPARDKYLTYKDYLSLLARQKGFILPEIFKVTYFLPIKKSASKKQKILLHNTPCRIKPDASNMQKGVEDILLPDGDEAVYDVHMVKRFTIGNGDGTGGYIFIEY